MASEGTEVGGEDDIGIEALTTSRSWTASASSADSLAGLFTDCLGVGGPKKFAAKPPLQPAMPVTKDAYGHGPVQRPWHSSARHETDVVRQDGGAVGRFQSAFVHPLPLREHGRTLVKAEPRIQGH